MSKVRLLLRVRCRKGELGAYIFEELAGKRAHVTICPKDADFFKYTD